ncbi:carboxypeptidase regulatory-like domain-containing protein (plasmid) [Natrinema thermotolerans]|nr:carboxypeptidase regulatory-like domain-containing protein [Natrinema thermotolerans]
MYTGSVDTTVKALGSDTGSEIWSSGAHSDTVMAIGSLGEHQPQTDPITGTVTDQDGNPVSNATVVAHSITEPALDKDDARSLERQAEDLKQELTDPLPREWDEFSDQFQTDNGLLDTDSFRSGIDGTYPLVHQDNDWGSASGFKATSSVRTSTTRGSNLTRTNRLSSRCGTPARNARSNRVGRCGTRSSANPRQMQSRSNSTARPRLSIRRPTSPKRSRGEQSPRGHDRASGRPGETLAGRLPRLSRGRTGESLHVRRWESDRSREYVGIRPPDQKDHSPARESHS